MIKHWSRCDILACTLFIAGKWQNLLRRFTVKQCFRVFCKEFYSPYDLINDYALTLPRTELFNARRKHVFKERLKPQHFNNAKNLSCLDPFR